MFLAAQDPGQMIWLTLWLVVAAAIQAIAVAIAAYFAYRSADSARDSNRGGMYREIHRIIRERQFEDYRGVLWKKFDTQITHNTRVLADTWKALAPGDPLIEAAKEVCRDLNRVALLMIGGKLNKATEPYWRDLRSLFRKAHVVLASYVQFEQNELGDPERWGTLLTLAEQAHKEAG